MKNKVCLLLLPLILLVGCSNVNAPLNISEENAIEVCLDESNIKEEDASNIAAQKKEDFYKVEYDYNKKHYTFKVSFSGIITSRKVKELDEEEIKKAEEEKKKEEPVVELANTDKGKKIIETALSNAGVTRDMVEKLTIVENADKTYTVKFTIIGGNTVITGADKDGNLISSNIQE